MTSIGNTDLLTSPITGFLCSRTVASKAILPCLDWAVEIAKDENATVMSTFHSPIEREVLSFLLQGKCNIIIVLARTLYKTIPSELKPALEANRILILSICNQPRISKQSALICNKYICEKSDSLTFGFLSPTSSLYPIYEEAINSGKDVNVLWK
ncbi:MAG: hypothetical protein MJZ41_04740 [Bacteroidaceae bacterium]|nr:hypothetical protein [Bacteroidaceae bacterium]